MYIIKKVNIFKLAKIMGLFSLIIGLIPGIISIITSFIFYKPGLTFMSWGFIFFPAIAGIIGFIYGLVIGLIYNRLAVFGYGVEIDIEKLPDEENKK